jgi:F0F1-type ATP synthase assembly protein I
MKTPLGSQRDWRAIGEASGLGCSVVASLLMCIVGGLFLDRWVGTQPIFTLVGVVLGLAAAGYLLYELAVISQPDKGLIGRKRARIPKQGLDPDEEES